MLFVSKFSNMFQCQKSFLLLTAVLRFILNAKSDFSRVVSRLTCKDFWMNTNV